MLVQAPPQRTILAIGAHAGDMELTAGAVLAAQAARGDRVVILHLTAGEGGNPKLDAKAYGEQKRREADAVLLASIAGWRGVKSILSEAKDLRKSRGSALRSTVID